MQSSGDMGTSCSQMAGPAGTDGSPGCGALPCCLAHRSGSACGWVAGACRGGMRGVVGCWLPPAGPRARTALTSLSPTAHLWGTEEVAAWLERLSLCEYKDIFTRHDIRGSELLHLERRDLKVLPWPQPGPHLGFPAAAALSLAPAWPCTAPGFSTVLRLLCTPWGGM